MDNNENIRQRVIKEIAVKFIVASIPTFGLKPEHVTEALIAAQRIYDEKIPLCK